MKTTITKLAVGIDMAMAKFDVIFASTDVNSNHAFFASASFDNNLKGFKLFIKWIKKHSPASNIPVFFLMEATGTYYEELAFFLDSLNLNVSVISPNIAKKFKDSLNIKSKTDKLDARSLSQFALERPFINWIKPDSSLRNLRSLTRQYQALSSLITEVSNRLHALEHSFQPNKIIIKSLKEQIAFLSKQKKSILSEIQNAISSDPDLKNKFDKINKVKGLGIISIATIIAETGGFEHFHNVKQLTSFAGLDVVHNQSGNFSGKSRISKKGNSHIRAVLHLPSLCVCRFEKSFQIFRDRLLPLKHSKMIVYTAVARKLLILIYSLWKNDSDFISLNDSVIVS